MIDWEDFFIVALATVLGAGSIVLFFSFGVRLGTEADDPARTRPRALAAASRACYALAGGLVLFGVYLIVPYLHY